MREIEPTPPPQAGSLRDAGRAFDTRGGCTHGAAACAAPRAWLAVALGAVIALTPQRAAAQDAVLRAYVVVGDAIPQPLTDTPGDARRGRTVVADRRAGLCLLCHSGPIPEERAQGNLAPNLAGAGSRFSAAQLRLRIVDARRLNPDTLMPPTHRIDGLAQVGAAWRGRPLLSAQQVEDVVAYLATLKD